jgi:hypothetical protein
LKCHVQYKCQNQDKDKKVLDVFKYNWNIGDTLKLNVKDKWNIDTFDAVIGNPPFQKSYNNKNGRVGGSSLWSEFINKFILSITENGFLLFITPCSWMTGGSNKQSGNILKGVFQKNTVLYLDIEHCSKYFRTGSTFSYYLIKKSFEDINFICKTSYKKSNYTSIIRQHDFRKLQVIPKLFTNTTLSIIRKMENKNNTKFHFERVRDLDSSSKKDRYCSTGIYKIRHKVVDIRQSNYFQNSCMKKHKIVISMPGYIKPIYDFECGCSDATLFYIVNNSQEAKHIIQLLNSKLYLFIINNYRELTGLNNHKNINRLCIVPKNIKEIFKYFNLTQKEIEWIEKFT